ncbi:MAG: BMP family ABC transporter substrate-binding protein [Eubacterium sp.]|nr:BMP family ABC transporter substrate-binding protein [Eubacterium sp.]
MTKFKKIAAIALCAVMTISMGACGGNKASDSSTVSEVSQTDNSSDNNADDTAADKTADNSSESNAASASSDMKVAMITDYGDITDQSFNQTTYEACKAFTAANSVDFTYYKPEGDSTAERVAMIDKAVADGYNVLVLPGYAFAEAIVETAEMYPDAKFIALDVSEFDLSSAAGKDSYSQDNVYSAVYKEELAGYMAGYAAVKMGYKKLGFLGGMAVPAVIRYGYGFVQGTGDAAKEMGLSDVELNYAYGNQFYGDADITAAMDTWYSGGTEVVFACGGGIYTSACEAAQKANKKVIGVDVDQASIIDPDYGEGMTVTSAMKGLTATVNTLLTAVKDGKWDDYKGQIQSLGLVSADDLTANYVQLPDSTQWCDEFTKDDYKALVGKLVNGEIKVSDDTSAEEPSSDVVKINFQGNIK